MPKNKTTPTINPALQRLAVPIGSLKPDPDNARERTPENLAAIKNSLQRFGQQAPVVALADGTIKAGNGRWLAAKELGWTEIAAVRLPKELEHLADEYALADNRTAELARWNPDRFKALIDKIKAAGADPGRLGFSSEAINGLLARIKPKPGASRWGADVGPSKPRTKRGDLWALGPHRLICGDATDPATVARLMGDRKAALVFTDPPYGVDYEDTKGQGIRNDAKAGQALTRLLVGAFKNAATATAAASDAAFYIWHASRTRDEFSHALKAAGLEERQYLIWAKPSIVLGHADYQWQHEPCFYAAKAGVRPAFYGDRAQGTVWRVELRPGTDGAGAAVIGPGLTVTAEGGGLLHLQAKEPKRPARGYRLAQGERLLIADTDAGTVWEVARDTMQPIHPNQKPIELAARAMRNSSAAGQAVLDLFGGSGSTLAAAEETGRHAYLVELDPKFCDAILRRWETLTKEKAEKL